MSRPSLYLLFADKDDVFARVIADLDDRKHSELGAVLDGVGTWADKLLSPACWGLHDIEVAVVHPDATDMFDLRFPAVQRVYARFEVLVTDLIAIPLAASNADANSAEVARTVVHGMRGLRATAADAEDMRRLIGIQVDLVVTALRRVQALRGLGHLPRSAVCLAHRWLFK